MQNPYSKSDAKRKENKPQKKPHKKMGKDRNLIYAAVY